MKPRDKALTLYTEFHYRICNDNGMSSTEGTEFCAKQCALVAANEVCDELVPSDFKDADTYANQKKYWEEVKWFINKL